MRTIAAIFIAFFLISGIVSASGTVPAVQAIKNTSIAPVAIPVPQPTADSGFIGNLVSPIIRAIPGATTQSPAQDIRPADSQGLTGLPQTAPSHIQAIPPGMSAAEKFADLQIHNTHAATPNDPCTPGSSSLRVMQGKIHIVYVQDKPASFWGGVLYERDGKAYTLLSDNANMYSMMQTAIIMDNEIGVAGYPVAGNPDDGWSLWLPSYRVCWMDVSRN